MVRPINGASVECEVILADARAGLTGRPGRRNKRDPREARLQGTVIADARVFPCGILSIEDLARLSGGRPEVIHGSAWTDASREMLRFFWKPGEDAVVLILRIADGRILRLRE